MAFTAVASVAGAGAVAAEVVTVATLATISTVVTVVGAITGSKELTKLGAGLGIASLGSSLVSAATDTATNAVTSTVADTANQAAGSATQSAAMAATDSGAITSAVSDPSAGLAQHALDTAAPTADIASNAAKVAPAAQETGSIAQQARDTASIGQDVAASTSPATDSTLGANAPSTPADTGVQVPAGASAPTGVDAPASPADQFANETTKLARQNSAAPGDFWGQAKALDSKSFFGKAFDWMGKNKEITAGAMNLGGGLLKGVGDAYQTDRLYDLKKQMIDRETANANAQPTVGFAVNPNTNVYPSQPKQYSGIVIRARS